MADFFENLAKKTNSFKCEPCYCAAAAVYEQQSFNDIHSIHTSAWYTTTGPSANAPSETELYPGTDLRKDTEHSTALKGPYSTVASISLK